MIIGPNSPKPVQPAGTTTTTSPIKKENAETKTNDGQKTTKDEFGIPKVAKPSGLVSKSYKIESISSLDIIAEHLGIPTNDLVAQLKDQKLLPANYNINMRHAHDPSFLKAGNTITVSVPKNKDDIAKDSNSPYRQWMKYERAHYLKCVETGKDVLASTNTETSGSSFYLMA